MVIAITPQRAIISISPKIGDLSPKNNIDQIKLRKSWTAKKYKASFDFLFLNPFCQIRNNETPIKK